MDGLILDAFGIPLRRRIGFLPGWEREDGGRVDLVSAVVVATEEEAEAEGTEEQNER